MIEKIISRNVGVDSVKPGQIQTVNVDRVMIHDIFIPFVAEKFEEMGFTKLWDPDKVVLIYDHMVPASTTDDIRHFKIGDAFAKKYGMKNVHRSDGICHQLMTECGYAKPGNIVFGTDSHTTTYGCVGCFSSGIGYTEMAAILGTGEMWVRVPETIKVVIDGKQTMIEKIISRNVGVDSVKPGQIQTVNVDRVMIHDIFIPFVAEKFEEMGFTKLWDPDKVVLIYDHMVPASTTDDIRHFKIGDAFAKKYGMKNVHRSDGICHQLMTECGYAKPGNIVFGTDSHTTTYGCVGCFSSGIGYTEMAAILGTGEMWVRVPETIKVVIDGKLPENVSSKDIILRLIGDLTAAGATYKALEFSGSTVDEMSVAARMTMSNMAIEAGAKAALFAPDEKTAEYSKVDLADVDWLYGDEDAEYCQTITYKAEDLVPVVACPSQVDKIRAVKEVEGTELDQVFIGSCTNGRLEDLKAAAEILKGKKVADYVKLIVTPASRKIYKQAVDAGYMKILAEAGAIITHPGCGLCCGRAGGIMTDGERVLATNNRNFLGRMGTSKVEIYLGSPKTAAASAIAGKIVEA